MESSRTQLIASEEKNERYNSYCSVSKEGWFFGNWLMVNLEDVDGLQLKTLQLVRILFTAFFSKYLLGMFSNRWTSQPIFIGNENLSLALLDSVVVSGRLPNAFPELISKNNLEKSRISSRTILLRFWKTFFDFV